MTSTLLTWSLLLVSLSHCAFFSRPLSPICLVLTQFWDFVQTRISYVIISMALTGKKLINTINLVAALAIFLCVSDLLETLFVGVDPGM